MKNIRKVPELPPRKSDAHKGDFGKVLVIAGSHGMTGAAILCAKGALRGGAGLVRIAVEQEMQPLLPLAVPEATTIERSLRVLRPQFAEVDAVVIGPGLTSKPSSKRLLQTVLDEVRVPIVVDADALNVLAPLRRKLTCKAQLVLTPHPGEAARLLSTTTERVQADRQETIARLCDKVDGVVVLKGEGTLVADGTRCFKNRTGNPGMATGGCGDVLAGLTGALLARGLSPFDAACLAVHVHGRAGDAVQKRIGENGLIAGDLPLAIGEELP